MAILGLGLGLGLGLRLELGLGWKKGTTKLPKLARKGDHKIAKIGNFMPPEHKVAKIGN